MSDVHFSPSAGNQTAAPAFVAAATGNFHETAVSPTVDAGLTAAANGSQDLDGNPRAAGASTDIGAYELVPADTTPPKTKITKKPKKKIKTRKSRVKVKVSFSSEAGASFECRLDKAAFKPCTSPYSAKAKSKAGKGKKHTISVRAIDAAGNVEAKPATVKFTVVKKKKKTKK